LCPGHHFFEAQPFHLWKVYKGHFERRVFLHQQLCVFTHVTAQVFPSSAKERESLLILMHPLRKGVVEPSIYRKIDS